ncbi:MAG: hypothetical protein H0V44_19235 [Planctomycetes bacterium]|nr:hypothetical protein [Planctomycetota bacterium]
MSAAGSIIVVDDRLGSAAPLAEWLQACGRPITVSGTYAEAAATISYHQLAGTGIPALIVGPLQREAVAFLADLRDQRLIIPTAFYTEAKSRDQDDALARQYELVAILHKPFDAEDRSRLDAVLRRTADAVRSAVPAAPKARRPASDDLVSSRAIASDEPVGEREHVASLDQLLGGGRSSSVSTSGPPPPRKELSAAELPSGVQRLLVDPMSTTVNTSGQAKAPQEPISRALGMVVVDDRFGSARLLVERLGMPGQTLKAAATWQEAMEQIDRLMVGNLGCELLIGPLVAEGVHLVKELRRRSLPTHVVFYTESATQSQDARLREQYGCLAIVRRSGMVETLATLIAELRTSPRRAPAVPVEPAKTTRASSARIDPLPAAKPLPPASGRLAAQHQPSGVFPPKAPPSSASSGRLRRSLTTPLPPTTADGQSPLQMDIDEAAVAGHGRAITCRTCAHEFVATVDRIPSTVTCAKCGAVNTLSR